MQATPGKPVQLVLSPWQPYTDDKEIVIDDSKVITITSPKDDIIKSYESHTSEIITRSGLITETKILNSFKSYLINPIFINSLFCYFAFN